MTTMGSRVACRILAWLIATGGVTHSHAAVPSRVLVLPTSVGERIDCGIPEARLSSPDPALATLARRVDDLIADAVEDAGMDTELRVNVSGDATLRGGCLGEGDLRGLARQSPILAPRIVVHDGKLHLRILAAQPNSPLMRLSVQEISEKDVDVRVVVMVSGLLAEEAKHPSAPKPLASPPNAVTPTGKPHSQGKGVLALTSAIFGGGIGYSLQRASGSRDPDPRLTYPLIALGTGIGLGASLIAAEEWDLSVGEAWFLNAGMLWPTTSGLMLAQAYGRDRYIYGLGGASAGMFLAAFALNFREISEGGALVAHSGGALGLLLGGLADMTYRGTTSEMPYRGMGYGAGLGVLLAGAAATQVQVSSSRVLFIDLSAGLGALTGAALGSPLLIFEDSLMSVKRQRAWLGLVGAGAVVGGGVGWYLTRGWTSQEHEGSGLGRLWPYLAPAPSPYDDEPPRAMGATAGVQGIF